MRLGIIGLPAAGKTTVFNALTGANLPVGTLAPTQDVHTAVVGVPDERVDRLSQLFHPKKTTYGKVTYVDAGALTADAAQTGLPGPLLNQLQQMDGLLQVVRAFDDPSVPHSLGTVDPVRDQRQLHDELMLNDMLAVERRVEKLNEEHQRGGRDRGLVTRELAVFERLRDCLGEGRALRDLGLTPDDDKSLSGFGLLTRKPWLVVVNLGEGQPAPNLGDLGSGVAVLPLQGRLEMEIAQLPADEIEAFLSEYGISEPGRVRVIQASYQLLNLLSFFTVGEDEVRAWTLPRGANALEAAAAIHTDLARGFIRAEVVGWEEVLDLGGWNQAREAGKLRIEGKEYAVKDGDILHVRFNI